MLLSNEITINCIKMQLHHHRSEGIFWQSEKVFGILHINYCTIPEKFKEKYNIPILYVDAIKQIEESKKPIGKSVDVSISEIVALTAEEQRVIRQMEEAKTYFPSVFNYIKELYPLIKTECIREYAQRAAVMNWVKNNYIPNTRGELKLYAKCYALVCPNHIDATKPTYQFTFGNFIHKLMKADADVVALCVDMKSVVKVQPRTSDFQMAMLAELYKQGRKINAAEAHRKLVKACAEKNEKPVSVRTVRDLYTLWEKNNEMYSQRYGEALGQKIEPYMSLIPAKNRNSQWQCDGWTMPFWGFKDGKGFHRYVVYVVRDNHSRRIVGWSIGSSENTDLILDALDDAMRNTGVFPYEIVTDKHSFHQTKSAALLRVETERMGAIWTVTVNAQRNQLAERYNQYLDALCKEYTGYLGKNITAKGKDAHPTPENLTEAAKTRNQKTVDEVKTIAAAIVTEFNNTPLPILGKVSPNEKYNASEDKHSYTVSEELRVSLIKPTNTYKVVRGQITISIGGTKHEFQLNAEQQTAYNNCELNVVYEDLTQGIYIYDPKTGEALGDVPPKRKVHGALADQTDEDRRILNQQTGRKKGVQKQAKTEAERLLEGLQENPEAVKLLNTYVVHKDIRKEADQNDEIRKAAAEKGVNKDMLPIRPEPKGVTVPEPATKTGKRTKEHPFTPPAAPLKKLTGDELLEMIGAL